MSREILFKGKHKEYDEWVEGDLIHEPFGECIQFIKNKCRSKVKIKPESVCQYTGLNDSTKWEELSEEEKRNFLSKWNQEKGRYCIKEDWNGRKIFEGDIISFSHSRIKKEEDELSFMPEYEEYNRNYAVEFVNTYYTYGLRARNKTIHFKLSQSTINTHNAKVIGDIFNNPELLNQRKE